MSEDERDGQLKLLLLAGGLSVRMGHPKHLLQLADGQPLYVHIIRQVKSGYPDLKTCYISLRKGCADLGPALSAIKLLGISVRVIYDHDEQGTNSTCDRRTPSRGPAAGMHAAHLLEPRSRFLVVACDFPLLTPDTIALLFRSYQDPVTCYENAEGFCEPLLGIWSADALDALSDNLRKGILGPSRVVKHRGGHTVSPPPGCEQWLLNTNTEAEWQRAQDLLRDQRSMSDHRWLC